MVSLEFKLLKKELKILNYFLFLANQETIVELIGFAKRVIPKTTSRSSSQPKNVFQGGKNASDESQK